MKTVLLIGGAGFIGTKLRAKLESQGHLVDVIDKKNGRDINDEYSFITDMKYSHVVFLAAEPNLRAVRRSPNDAIKTMTSGLMHSLRFYIECHFTYISSSMVYGNWNGTSVSEFDSRSPIDLYGQLKLSGEGIVKELHNNYTIIRPTAVYGPGDDPSRVLPLFIKKAKAGEQLTVKGHDNELDFTHVDDIVQGIILGMDSPDPNSIYNISYGQAVPLENVANYICEKVGSGTVKVELNDFEYPKRGSMDISKAKQVLGYKPTKNVFQGIDELV
jgi:nucleoside-diphosphate-sugar epimerase